MKAAILIVEDDEALRSTLARHLRGHGYTVVEADSAEDTLAALHGGLRPSLVILDINLPGDTGWSLLRSPALDAAGRPPVVVASATAINPSRLREYGVAGYLPKPFPLETLVATVERLLRPKEASISDE
jgi:DNA-binding response OmpR family regulator